MSKVKNNQYSYKSLSIDDYNKSTDDLTKHIPTSIKFQSLDQVPEYSIICDIPAALAASFLQFVFSMSYAVVIIHVMCFLFYFYDNYRLEYLQGRETVSILV